MGCDIGRWVIVKCIRISNCFCCMSVGVAWDVVMQYVRCLPDVSNFSSLLGHHLEYEISCVAVAPFLKFNQEFGIKLFFFTQFYVKPHTLLCSCLFQVLSRTLGFKITWDKNLQLYFFYISVSGSVCNLIILGQLAAFVFQILSRDYVWTQQFRLFWNSWRGFVLVCSKICDNY